MLGDGSYNSFVARSERGSDDRGREDRGRDFHDRLMEMYKYEEQRKNRKVSQIAM